MLSVLGPIRKAGWAVRFRPDTKNGGGGGGGGGGGVWSGGGGGGRQLVPEGGISYEWGGRPPPRAYAGSGAATNRLLLLKGTVHLVGVVVGLEALVMSSFYREVLSAVLVVVFILQSVFGMHE